MLFIALFLILQLSDQVHPSTVPIFQLRFNWFVFFSPSGFVSIEESHNTEAFLRTVQASNSKIAAIGVTTSRFLMDHGLNVSAVALSPTPDALVEAIVAFEGMELIENI